MSCHETDSNCSQSRYDTPENTILPSRNTEGQLVLRESKGHIQALGQNTPYMEDQTRTFETLTQNTQVQVPMKPSNKNQRPQPNRRNLPSRNNVATKHRHAKAHVDTPTITNNQMQDTNGFFKNAKFPSPGYIGNARREMRGNPQPADSTHVPIISPPRSPNPETQGMHRVDPTPSRMYPRDASPPLGVYTHIPYVPNSTSTPPPAPRPDIRVRNPRFSEVNPQNSGAQIETNMPRVQPGTASPQTGPVRDENRELVNVEFGSDLDLSVDFQWDNQDLGGPQTRENRSPPEQSAFQVRPDTDCVPPQPTLIRKVNKVAQSRVPLAPVSDTPRFSEITRQRELDIPPERNSPCPSNQSAAPAETANKTPVRKTKMQNRLNFQSRMEQNNAERILKPIHGPRDPVHDNTLTEAEHTTRPSPPLSNEHVDRNRRELDADSAYSNDSEPETRASISRKPAKRNRFELMQDAMDQHEQNNLAQLKEMDDRHVKRVEKINDRVDNLNKIMEAEIDCVHARVDSLSNNFETNLKEIKQSDAELKGDFEKMYNVVEKGVKTQQNNFKMVTNLVEKQNTTIEAASNQYKTLKKEVLSIHTTSKGIQKDIYELREKVNLCQNHDCGDSCSCRNEFRDLNDRMRALEVAQSTQKNASIERKRNKTSDTLNRTDNAEMPFEPMAAHDSRFSNENPRPNAPLKTAFGLPRQSTPQPRAGCCGAKGESVHPGPAYKFGNANSNEMPNTYNYPPNSYKHDNAGLPNAFGPQPGNPGAPSAFGAYPVNSGQPHGYGSYPTHVPQHHSHGHRDGR